MYGEKILTTLVLPPGGLILLALIGLWLAWRDWRFGKTIVVVALAALWTLATPWAADALRYSLERNYPPQPIEEIARADAIVVLGGGIRPPTGRNPYPDLGRAADRYWHAARLWRAGKAPEIVISGGGVAWIDARGSEADAASRFMTDLGVPANRTILESASANTRENAEQTATILRARGAQRILLVTSALHMRRAISNFERIGLDVIPAPTDHEVGRDPFTILRVLPSAEALHDSRRALHEYVGRMVAG